MICAVCIYLECDREPNWAPGEHRTGLGNARVRTKPRISLQRAICASHCHSIAAHASMHYCIRQLSMVLLPYKYIDGEAIDNSPITYLLQPMYFSIGTTSFVWLLSLTKNQTAIKLPQCYQPSCVQLSANYLFQVKFNPYQIAASFSLTDVSWLQQTPAVWK